MYHTKCLSMNERIWKKISFRRHNHYPLLPVAPSPPYLPRRFNWEMTTLFYYYHSYYWTLTVGELLPKLSDFFAVSHFEKLGTDRTAVENTGFSWNGRLNFAFLWRQERSRTNEKWMLGENWRVSQNSGMKIKITALSVRCTFFFPFSSWKKTKKKLII